MMSHVGGRHVVQLFTAGILVLSSCAFSAPGTKTGTTGCVESPSWSWASPFSSPKKKLTCSFSLPLPRRRIMAEISSCERFNLKSHNKASRLNLSTATTTGDDVTVSSSTTKESSLTGPNNNLLPYNWKEQWYALTFASYVPNPSQSAETTTAAVFGHPLVLWRSEDDGPIHCADDVCPHRSAALSEGRVRDGKLECLYHGWQFEGRSPFVTTADDTTAAITTTTAAPIAGSCVRIPQLEIGTPIPKRACLRMREARVIEGIVWVWMGDDNDEPKSDPPRSADGLDDKTGKKDGFLTNDFQCDLPYDHSFLVENLIDPAHIPISHDRTPGGGKRENAQAFEMQVDEDNVTGFGFTGRYRNAAAAAVRPDSTWTETAFEAPGIIRYRTNRGRIIFAAALHCMPLALGRSRLLFRVYSTGLPWFVKVMATIKPKWLRNLNSCKILEQDVGLITTQEDHFARNPNHAMSDDFLLMGSSDKFVAAYRKWLDRVGHGMPWFQGLVSSSSNVNAHINREEIIPPGLILAGHLASGHDVVETRYHRHVLHCPETRNALRRIKKLKRASLAISAIAATTAACGLVPITREMGGGRGATMACRAIVRCLMVGPVFPLLSLSAAALLHGLEQRFYVSFRRREQLAIEKGI